jgi:hypothetical protein
MKNKRANKTVTRGRTQRREDARRLWRRGKETIEECSNPRPWRWMRTAAKGAVTTEDDRGGVVDDGGG